MAKVIIIYHSRTGTTKTMAELVAQGVTAAGGSAELRPVKDASAAELIGYDGIILGSPTQYGHSTGVVRQFLDTTVKVHGKLKGKVGGAFASSWNIGGGNETTILDLLHFFLVHGMVIQGSCEGAHYGPVAVDKPAGDTAKACHELGVRVVELIKRMQD